MRYVGSFLVAGILWASILSCQETLGAPGAEWPGASLCATIRQSPLTSGHELLVLVDPVTGVPWQRVLW